MVFDAKKDTHCTQPFRVVFLGSAATAASHELFTLPSFAVLVTPSYVLEDVVPKTLAFASPSSSSEDDDSSTLPAHSSPSAPGSSPGVVLHC